MILQINKYLRRDLVLAVSRGENSGTSKRIQNNK